MLTEVIDKSVQPLHQMKPTVFWYLEQTIWCKIPKQDIRVCNRYRSDHDIADKFKHHG